MTARSLPLARPMLGATLPFALPIGLSAFLLFSVQPLIGRLVLPVFGGTPAVWATMPSSSRRSCSSATCTDTCPSRASGRSARRCTSCWPAWPWPPSSSPRPTSACCATRGSLRSSTSSASCSSMGWPAGPDDDDPARVGLVRGRQGGACRRRPVPAVRAEQRGSPGPAGLSPHHRAAPRPGRPADGVVHRLRRPRRPPRRRDDPRLRHPARPDGTPPAARRSPISMPSPRRAGGRVRRHRLAAPRALAPRWRRSRPVCCPR